MPNNQIEHKPYILDFICFLFVFFLFGMLQYFLQGGGCKSLSFCCFAFSQNFAFCFFNCDDFDRSKGISVGSSKGVLQMRFVQLITLIRFSISSLTGLTFFLQMT